MLIFKKLSDYLHYWFDSVKMPRVSARIECFECQQESGNMIVVYRLGGRKLLNKMEIHQFEQEYFERVSVYDQHRLTKMSSLQNVHLALFKESHCSKDSFMNYLREEVKNEYLF